MNSACPLPSFFVSFLSALVLSFVLEMWTRQGRKRLPCYRRHLRLWVCFALVGLGLGLWKQALAPILVGVCIGTLVGLGLSCLPFLWGRRLSGCAWQRGTPQRADATRPLILVADAHWSEELTGLQEATLAHPEADWLFLGDIFDLWVGLPGMETESQRAFLWWVRERRRLGRWVGYWMGNREFALDVLAPHFDLMGEGVGGALPLERLAWEHGDLINGQDWRYRIWNLLSRSGIFWVIARLLPTTWMHTQFMKLEKTLRTVNQNERLQFPREAFRAAAQEQPEYTYITGHFHTFEIEANGTAIPWAHHGRFMVWRDQQIQPLS